MFFWTFHRQNVAYYMLCLYAMPTLTDENAWHISATTPKNRSETASARCASGLRNESVRWCRARSCSIVLRLRPCSVTESNGYLGRHMFTPMSEAAFLKGEILGLGFRKTGRHVAALTLEQMCHLFYLKRARDTSAHLTQRLAHSRLVFR